MALGTYWSTMDFDSESMCSVSMPIRHRDYVDPWDMENYVYMRRHLGESSSSSSSQSQAQSDETEQACSTFLYVSNPYEDFPGRYAATDERVFFNERFDQDGLPVSPMLGDTMLLRGRRASHISPYNSHKIYGGRFLDTPYIEIDESPSSLESSAHSAGSGSCQYYYQQNYVPCDVAELTTNRKRSSGHVGVMAPANIGQDVLYCSPYDSYGNEGPCLECIIEGPITPKGAHSLEDVLGLPGDTPVPTYDLHRRRKRSEKKHKNPTGHFGLSPCGHLKIDYSSNWNSLDRYIGK